MLLRIDRNPRFWERVARHPAVAPYVLHGMSTDGLGPLVQSVGSVPLASDHGGFIFLPRPQLDTYELHTMFTPEGWGREAAAALRVAFRYMFDTGMSACHTYEQQDYYRSRPPKSHGWVATSEFHDAGIGSVRSWVLTRDRWCASPVGRQETDHATRRSTARRRLLSDEQRAGDPERGV